LAEDPEKVSYIIKEYLSKITPYQNPKCENSYHMALQMLLLGMGFNVDSERANSSGRLDLMLRIDNYVYLVIELKYVPGDDRTEEEKRLAIEAENKTLASKAIFLLSNEQCAKFLAEAFIKKFPAVSYKKLIPDAFSMGLTEDERNRIIADNAPDLLTVAESSEAIAAAARSVFSKSKIRQILGKAAPKPKMTASKIEAKLAEAVQNALADIEERNYYGGLRLKAAKIMALGIAIYGNGSEVASAFGKGWKKGPEK
jgi:hypothetical protein